MDLSGVNSRAGRSQTKSKRPSRRQLLSFTALSGLALWACTEGPSEIGLEKRRATGGQQPKDLPFTAVVSSTLSTAGAQGHLQLPLDLAVTRTRSLVPVTARETRLIEIWRSEHWTTNFHIKKVLLSEIHKVGTTRDAIEPIDKPRFWNTRTARTFIDGREPVIAFAANGDVRAYPLQVLLWHEVVNDVVGGEPVAVTYCPRTNTWRVFDRRVVNATVRFGVSGNVRNGGLLMWDTLTQTWWQQLNGEAVVGDLTGIRLETRPSLLVSYSDFQRAFPDGRVLSTEWPVVHGSYGTTPYPGYDSRQIPSMYFSGRLDARLPATRRVLAMAVDGDALAVDLDRLVQQRTINISLGDRPVVAVWFPGTVSVLDQTEIRHSRDTGTAMAYERKVGERTLSFDATAEGFKDRETGSTWNLWGHGIRGPMQGARLSPMVHSNSLWFSWVGTYPETRLLT
ncbi:MAG: hypothetical protein CMO68_07025 [Verrucomicrobiales bacterium]|nr:hypothetical protein [Verrucomicrobiales bacterium]